MLLLSGPTASGKNTIANEIALKLERCAVVDFDLVRQMFVNPHKTPWNGDEGLAQQHLGVEMVCNLAQKFETSGWQVIILDVLSPTTLKIYKERLQTSPLKIVQLLPSYDVLLQRFNNRGPVLSYEELEDVYNNQKDLKGYDLHIDNSQLSAKSVAKELIKFWQTDKVVEYDS